MIEEVRIVQRKLKYLNKNKQKIEKTMGVSLDINKDGLVTIKGEDSLGVWLCKQVVWAVSLGFEIDKALRLKNEGYIMEVLDVRDFGRGTRKDIIRLKGRVIGEQGKCKKRLQQDTGTDISISGKRVAIIGKIEGVNICKMALETILSGAKHVTAFKNLEKEILKRKREKFGF